MLASIQILVLVTVTASLVYWLLPAGWIEGRRAVLLVVSGVLIYIWSPETLLIAVLTALLAWLLYALTWRHPRYGWLPWLIVLPLVVNAIVPLSDLIPLPVGSPRSPLLTNLATLGLSFYTFKLYISIKQGLKLGRLPFREVITTTLFYPAFPMGPIDGSQKFDREALSRDPDVRRWVMGVGRIGIGVVKVFVLGAWVKGTLSVELFGVPMEGVYAEGWPTPLHALAFAFVSFLYLYVNFSGFTDIAIGAGWMFNLDLTENFRFPLIAHSIQNFWQRWHLTLAAFVSTYVFKPLVRRTGRPALAIFVAFTLVGLWHEVSLGYLLWGLGHGSALALTLAYRERMRGRALLPARLRRIAGVPVTLAFVAFLSAVANADSPTRLVNYLEALVGL